LSEGKEILDFLRANFPRLSGEFDRIDTRVDGLTTSIGLAAEIAPDPNLSPRAGRGSDPRSAEGEGQQT